METKVAVFNRCNSIFTLNDKQIFLNIVINVL